MDFRKAAVIMIAFSALAAVAVSGCTSPGPGDSASADNNGFPSAAIANPASSYCIQNMSGTLNIAETPQGQAGYCSLPDGRICEEWELFRSGNCTAPIE